MNTPPLLEKAQKNIRDSITVAIGHQPDRPALLVYDGQSLLARLLAEAYRLILSSVNILNFDRVSPGEILEAVNALAPGNLVVLVQSTSFRLNEFRFRIELFNRSLKVIEHPHLSRIREEEYSVYIDALAYDPAYYRSVGPRLKKRLDRAQNVKVVCHGTELIYDTPFEEAKLNIGDYGGMKNIGGQFPIGEVFTEPKEIVRVNGRVKLFAFGNQDFSVCTVEEPIVAVIENGVLVDAPDAPRAFRTVIEEIRSHEEKVWLREFGLGLNRALTRINRVNDIGAYERMCGIHLSLGAKHAVYTKLGFPKKNKFHVDVFAAVERVEIDGEIVYAENSYIEGAE
ncbi:MAG: M29 family metallopeptidase [Nitrospiria bacterium]